MKATVSITDLRISQIEVTDFGDPQPTYVRGATTFDARLLLGKISGSFSGKLTPGEENLLGILLATVARRIQEEIDG